jgi:transposase
LRKTEFPFALDSDSWWKGRMPISRFFWFTEEQIDHIKPCYPNVRGVGRADDCKVLSGIFCVIRNGLQWADAPAEYARTRRFTIGSGGGQKTEYLNASLKNWHGKMPKVDAGRQGVLMIDATHLKAHRTASSLKKGDDEPRLIGRTKAG